MARARSFVAVEFAPPRCQTALRATVSHTAQYVTQRRAGPPSAAASGVVPRGLSKILRTPVYQSPSVCGSRHRCGNIICIFPSFRPQKREQKLGGCLLALPFRGGLSSLSSLHLPPFSRSSEQPNDKTRHRESGTEKRKADRKTGEGMALLPPSSPGKIR